MNPLEKNLRNQLERTVKQARDVSEDAARAALEQLGVSEATPFAHLSEQDRELRRRLRAHGRQLGDTFLSSPSGRGAGGEGKFQSPDHLIEEVAYEHWHRMLFARFLAANNLLMYWPKGDNEPIDVDLETCQGLLDDGEEQASSVWELAARFAARMLPQIFRLDSPVFQLVLPPEHQQKLERLVADLPVEVFTASDSLGWVYQFWQAKKKDEINASEVKIGSRELPAVTQLFTEPYMVSFLLDNALGAWWAARRFTEADLKNASSEEELRRKAAIPGVPLQYLRFVKIPSPSGRGVRDEGKKAPIPEDILQNARELRKNQTDAEKLLWGLLRDYRFAGRKFRRQHPINRYILDFYCHELKLAIELEGGQHNEDTTQQYDEERTRLLNEQGIRLIRFWNNEVLQQTDSVLEVLWNAFTPTPLPEGEGLMWQPAAGTFDHWPEKLADLKILDPCCGSGHFLVAAFLMLVPMRMALEGFSAKEAVDAVLRENIHGLELDQRCVELAAFALALTAWKYPDLPSSSGGGTEYEGGAKPIGFRPLPELNVACSGLSVSVAKEEWKQLGLGKKNLTIALDWIHDTFKDAPVLGSLLNPAKTDAAKLVQWDELSVALEQALKQEQSEVQQEVVVVAQGLAKAATLLAGQYQLVITNVPYLARSKQNERLRDFCERHYSAAKNDLATVFLDRCLELCVEGGTASMVLPQNWLFLISYKKFREKLLKNDTWHLIARLGPQAFQTPMWDFNVQLITLSRGYSSKERSSLFGEPCDGNMIRGVDVSKPRTASEKATQLLTVKIKCVEQAKQLENPDARVGFQEGLENVQLLIDYVDSYEGIGTGDLARFQMFWWESMLSGDCLIPFRTTSEFTKEYSGYTGALLWESGEGEMVKKAREQNSRPTRGFRAWGKKGIAINRMRNLESSLFLGQKFDCNIAAIIPKSPKHLPGIWAFCSSPEYPMLVRDIDQALKVTNHTLAKVPFDLDYWTQVAAEKYPNDLPKPYTDDPTQWIFHGHPCGSVVWDKETKWTSHGPLRTDDTVLQVAVARLLGYHWPAELDASMELADEQREWVKHCEALLPFADDDGIVCIPPVRGEASASERLLNLLAAVYGNAWSNDTLAGLLKSADHAGKTLETWLREKFFTQHCKLFQHRPFIWHIWDGLRDGFAALVNYHKFDRKNLETLIYTYLGDWISRQKQDIASGVDGAQERLATAESLKKKLELILEGDAPYDIFVRWKPLEKQPIGWDPDLNDGVRLNIRPFLSVPDVGKKGAGVLRDKPNINWNKDRGKDVESAPWYHLFNGDRINDHHLTLAEKRAIREAAE
ncbi:DUF559 domain-containing protein [Nitrosomonas communis]|uniref:site-specific DNA-methyltransferase (adenine-specific) n=1 Tax=Nitrosomonas communis TaxID=44574 RepID=A0A1H2SZ61_9PROT|nr:DUF559 domain-containing protein [Nitrosomonas communis]SDW36973.1 Very-short-patch-repair endonuclease [Nitrosomonas communis]